MRFVILCLMKITRRIIAQVASVYKEKGLSQKEGAAPDCFPWQEI